jgi:HK97 family phage prohead protease
MDFDIIADGAEARSVAFTDMDIKKGGRSFRGYAGVYGQEFDAGTFIETMLPPMFRSAIAQSPNVPMLWHHNQTLPPFATTGAGTLELAEDKRGLLVNVEEIDERHVLGPTLISMVERGEVRGMSVGMVVGRANQKITERGGKIHRAVTGLKKLLDVSPTWEPAYEGTSAELRSLTEAFQQVPALVPEQTSDGESQSAEDGQHQETDGVVTDAPACETCGKSPDGDDACACNAEVLEEQRSGVDADAFAARKRRLQMMGLSLPS